MGQKWIGPAATKKKWLKEQKMNSNSIVCFQFIIKIVHFIINNSLNESGFK